MMKKVKLLFNIMFVVMAIGCQKETADLPYESKETVESNTPNEPSNITAEVVSLNAMPGITKDIKRASGKLALSWSSTQRRASEYWLNEGEIVKTLDSVGNITYAIQIETINASPTVVYNLVATERVDGVPIDPFVMKYEFKDGDRYEYAEQVEKHFEGSIDVYSLDEFVNATGLGARGLQPKPCYYDVGDPVASTTSTSSSGGSSGGGGSGGVAGTRSYGIGSPTFGRGLNVSIIGGGRGRTGYVEVGRGEFHTSPDSKMQKASVDPCPGGELMIPINVVQQVLFADCKSFEFANGLNGSIKGAATVGVNNTFVAYEQISPTQTNFMSTNITYPLLFFTMPAGWTNGRAATLTAQAVSASINNTQLWFAENPNASKAQIEGFWWKSMKMQMGYKGGAVSKVPLFNVPSPTPYLTAFFGTGNCG